MTELKTQRNSASVETFIESLEHETRKMDAQTLLSIYREIFAELDDHEKEDDSIEVPSSALIDGTMWGTSIIGFGEYEYSDSRNNRHRWMRGGFSPRKNYISVYLMAGVLQNPDLMSKLGKYKHGKSCLNINKLGDVDLTVLRKLIREDLKQMNSLYPNT